MQVFVMTPCRLFAMRWVSVVAMYCIYVQYFQCFSSIAQAGCDKTADGQKIPLR